MIAGIQQFLIIDSILIAKSLLILGSWQSIYLLGTLCTPSTSLSNYTYFKRILKHLCCQCIARCFSWVANSSPK